MNLFKSLCLIAVAAVTLTLRADTLSTVAPTVYFKPTSTYLLATNLATVPKFATNTDTAASVGTNTFLSQAVPVPVNEDLAICPQWTPAGSLAGTSNVVVGFELSDGLTYTSTTDPLTVTFALNSSNTVSAWVRVPKTNFYGASFIIPDSVANQSLTNGTLGIGYGLIYP